jgi:hypothetical protein
MELLKEEWWSPFERSVVKFEVKTAARCQPFMDTGSPMNNSRNTTGWISS